MRKVITILSFLLLSGCYTLEAMHPGNWLPTGDGEEETAQEQSSEKQSAEEQSSDDSDSWLSWGGDDKEEAATDEAGETTGEEESGWSSWIPWGDDKKEEAAAAEEEAETTEESSGSWLSWGKKDGEAAESEEQETERPDADDLGELGDSGISVQELWSRSIGAGSEDDRVKLVPYVLNDRVFVADSLEELATKTGIDPAGLRETVEGYNRACDTGRDDLFDKKAKYLRPVKRPPFYAGKKTGDGLRGWNGIRINHEMEVLTDDYAVIPGLYAAGMDVASEVYHDTYPMVLPATAMGFAVNGGRIAGENAAAYVKSA